jgi:hypothetical protein
MSDEATTVAEPPAPVVVPPPAPPAPPPVVVAPLPTPFAPAPVVTPEHISALHRHLDQIGHALKEGFEAVIAFVRKNAPTVEAGAAALATAVPVVGPIAGAIEKAAGTAAAVAACCAHADQPHGRNGCKAPGCSCSATS